MGKGMAENFRPSHDLGVAVPSCPAVLESPAFWDSPEEAWERSGKGLVEAWLGEDNRRLKQKKTGEGMERASEKGREKTKDKAREKPEDKATSKAKQWTKPQKRPETSTCTRAKH